MKRRPAISPPRRPLVPKYSVLRFIQWAAGPTGVGSDHGRAVAVDNDGNVYVTGNHESGLDFGNGITIPDEGASYGVFVVRYNSAGTNQWASGPTGTGADYGQGVAVDNDGNVYVTGNHGCGLDFGNGVSLQDEGSVSMFVVKYNGAGIAQWVKGSSGSAGYGQGVAVDSGGNVYVTGCHWGGLDFGNGVAIPDEGGTYGVFVVKYNSAGIAQWAKGPTGPGIDRGYGVAVDSDGNVYVAGYHVSGLDFGNGIVIYNELSDGVFVVKYDSAGIAQWAAGPTGAGADYGWGVAVDGSGNVYVTGSHQSDVNFGNGVTVADEGGDGVFVVKYDSAGVAQWAKGPAGMGIGFDFGRSVVVDSDSNVYVAGRHGCGLDFGNGVTIPDEGGTYGVFVVKYNSAGVAQWAKGPTGPGKDLGYGVAVDSGGNVYVTGKHESGLDFGNGIVIYNEPSDGVFVVKYNSAGVAQWAAGPTGAGGDYGWGVAVDGNGNVCISGTHANGLDFGNGVTIPDEGSLGVFVVKYGWETQT